MEYLTNLKSLTLETIPKSNKVTDQTRSDRTKQTITINVVSVGISSIENVK